MKIIILYKKHARIIRYLITGVMTTGVSLGTYYLSVMTVLDPRSGIQLQIANLFSWIASVTFAYITNRIYVFKSNNSHILQEAVSFYSSRIATLLMDMATMFILVTLAGINDKIAKLTVQFIVMTLNYLISIFWVFKQPRPHH